MTGTNWALMRREREHGMSEHVIFEYKFLNGERRFYICKPETTVSELLAQVESAHEVDVSSGRIYRGFLWPEDDD